MIVRAFYWKIIWRNEIYILNKFTVKLGKKAEKQLDKLPDKVAKQLLKAISKLSNNPRPFGYIK